MTTPVTILLQDKNLSDKDKVARLFKEVIPRDHEDLGRVVQWGLHTFGFQIGTGSHLWYKLSQFNAKNDKKLFTPNDRDTTKRNHAGVAIALADYPKLLQIMDPVETEAEKFKADCKELKAQVAGLDGMAGLLIGIGFGLFGFPGLAYNSVYIVCSRDVLARLKLGRFRLPVIWLGSLVAAATLPTSTLPTATLPTVTLPAVERAQQFCFQGAVGSEQQSKRRALLNKASFAPYRQSDSIGTDRQLCCGDGISNPQNGISQGSFCVAVRPIDDSNPRYPSNRQYGATCCHVAVYPPEYGTLPEQLTYGGSIETPGRLDRARDLYVLWRRRSGGTETVNTDTNDASIVSILDQQWAVCGTDVVAAELGCDPKLDEDGLKWRKDCAVFEVAQGYTAINRPRFNNGLANQGLVGTDVRIETVARKRASKGEKVWKMGSASGVTEGIVAGSKLLCFEKRSMAAAVDFEAYQEIDGGTRDEFEGSVDECCFMQVLPSDEGNFGEEGDSGGTVVRLQDGLFAFEGMLSNLVDMDGIDSEAKIGLYIPSDAFFRQIQKKTSVKWVLG